MGELVKRKSLVVLFIALIFLLVKYSTFKDRKSWETVKEENK